MQSAGGIGAARPLTDHACRSDYCGMVRASLIWLAIGIVCVLLMPPKRLPQLICNADCCLPGPDSPLRYTAAGPQY